VDDSEGIATQLEENLLRSIAAYRDPWREAYTPKTPNQFASLLRVIQ
jgi:nitrite reductase (NADH) large subunit